MRSACKNVCLLALLLYATIVRAASISISPVSQGPFYVSPAGSDSAGDGSASAPWRQIQTATNWIHSHRINQVQTQDIVVNIAPGSYAPFSLTSSGVGTDDSGHNGHVIDYVSTGGPGAAVIDAGVQVTGWRDEGGGIVSAPVPNVFSTMYVNGVRAVHARYPNLAMSAGFTSTREPYLISLSDSFVNTRLAYNPADFTAGFDPSTVSASDLRVTAWCGGFSEWKTDTLAVSSVDAVNHFINFSAPCKFALYDGTTGSRYFVEGTREMLDATNEWWLDKVAMRVYYIPAGPIASQTVVIPTTTQAITVTGLSQKSRDHVTNVVIDGLAVKDTDFTDTYTGGWPVLGSIQYPSPIPWVYPFFAWLAQKPQFHIGAIHLQNTDHVTIQNVLVEDAGLDGIFIDGWATNDVVQRVWIRRIGGAGIRFEGQFPLLGDWSNNDTVHDFRINNIGELSGEGSGIELAQTGSSVVDHGYIFNGPRKGIWVLASTGQNAVPWTIYTHGNWIHHVLMQFLDQDSGDTNALGFDSLSSLPAFAITNTAEQIIIDSIAANSSIRDIHPMGVYDDDETFGQVMNDIEVTNTPGGLLHVAGSGSTISTPVVTNCSFNNDGTVNSGFNAALMDTANINVTASFPWPCTSFDSTGACTSNQDPD